MNRRPKITVVGSSNTDMVIKTERLPGPGETVLGGEFVMVPGGKGANQAVAAARLGADVHLVARLGADVFGDKSLDGFRREGIRTEHVVRDAEKPSGVALIFVDSNGENSIAVASGANMALSPDDVDRARDALIESAVLLLQLEVPLETVVHAAELASDHGVMVVLTPAPARPLPEDLLRRVDVLVPNETEACMLLGLERNEVLQDPKTAVRLLHLGVESAVVTLGSRGAMVVTSEDQRLVPAFHVEAVDTTAAGDVFAGALAFGLASGKDLLESAELARRAAAISVMKMGAQSSMPTMAEVEDFPAR